MNGIVFRTATGRCLHNDEVTVAYMAENWGRCQDATIEGYESPNTSRVFVVPVRTLIEWWAKEPS